jgi:hypothetical protein
MAPIMLRLVPEHYRRTQIGWFVLVAAIVPTIMVIPIVFIQNVPWAVAFVSLVAVGVALNFGWLTVAVYDDAVTVAFGIGLVHKRISLAEIRSTRLAEAPWYAGVGMRMIRDGWLYNVAMGPVVELELESGRRMQIGTPEAEVLLAAIESRRSA